MEICGIFSQLLWFYVGTSLWEDPWPRVQSRPPCAEALFSSHYTGSKEE